MILGGVEFCCYQTSWMFVCMERRPNDVKSQESEDRTKEENKTSCKPAALRAVRRNNGAHKNRMLRTMTLRRQT